MIVKHGNVLLFEEGGFVLRDIRVENGKIKEIAPELQAAEGEEVFDASGKYVTPGMIAAHSHICISEEGMGSIGDDCCDYSGALTPELEVLDGIYPFDRAVIDSVRAGVTAACVCPGSDGVVGGVASTITLNGTVADEMLLRRYTAMKCSVGENPKTAKHGFESRMGVAFKTLTDHLDGSIDKDSFTANLSMGSTGTYVCRIINPILPAYKLNSLPCEALQEQWTGIDINNDNNLNSTLEYDQERNRRDQSGNACIGAVEIENPATVSAALKEIDCQITIENSNLNIYSEKSSQSILYELSGNMIGKSPANVTSHTFSNLHQGIYLLSIKSSDIKRNFKIQIK